MLFSVAPGLPPASWCSEPTYVYLNICLSLFVYIGPEKPKWGGANLNLHTCVTNTAEKLVKVWQTARVPTALLVLPNLFLFNRLGARDFHEVILHEAEGQINFRLIEVESK